MNTANGADRIGHSVRFLLDLGAREALRRRLAEPRLERFIGVIHRPDTGLARHYAQAVLPQRFDAHVWFDETSAVTPLGPEHISVRRVAVRHRLFIKS